MELTREDIQKIRAELMDEIRAEIKKEIDLNNDKEAKLNGAAIQAEIQKESDRLMKYIDTAIQEALSRLEVRKSD